MESDLSEIMTVAEVAEYLRIPTSSVYKLAQEGKIPSQKIGRHWRFYRPNLVAWIERGLNFDQKDQPKKLDFS